LWANSLLLYGEGGEIRTRDPNLGKVSSISMLPFFALPFFPFSTIYCFREECGLPSVTSCFRPLQTHKLHNVVCWRQAEY